MSAKKLAEALCDGLDKWMQANVPLRVPDHAQLNKRVEEIVEQVRKQATVEAYNLAIEDALTTVQGHRNEWQRDLAERLKALPNKPSRRTVDIIGETTGKPPQEHGGQDDCG